MVTKNEQQKLMNTPNNNNKIMNFHGYLQTLILSFIFFCSGMIFGFSLTFYLKDSFPLNFQLNSLFPLPLDDNHLDHDHIPSPSPNPNPSPINPDHDHDDYHRQPPQEAAAAVVASTIHPPPPPPLSPSPPPLPPLLFLPPSNNYNDNNNNTTEMEMVIRRRRRSRIGIKKFIKPEQTAHDMTDDELLWRASMIPRVASFPFKRTPKVAFMFLVRKTLSFAPLWQAFFKGQEGLYSIYVHTQPFVNATYPTQSVFHGRRIPSKVVSWGKFNMVEAEKRLIANALLDFSNQRFVLLSESCIPLFNFTTVYNYLMNSKTSFVESYDLWGPVGKGRYNRRMNPTVTVEQWKKGAQWFEMDRELAIEIISDRKYAPLFKKYCKPACYSDEHYLPTLVFLKYPLKNANRTLTWVDWSKGGPHPSKYGRTEVTEELLNRMKFGSTCKYNGKKTNICYMFARKFSPNALDRLLRFAPTVMMINP